MTPVEFHPAEVVVSLGVKRIDSSNSQELFNLLKEGQSIVREKKPQPKFVLDLSDIEFMSSAGIRAVWDFQKMLIVRLREESSLCKDLKLSGFVPGIFKTEFVD